MSGSVLKALNYSLVHVITASDSTPLLVAFVFQHCACQPFALFATQTITLAGAAGEGTVFVGALKNSHVTFKP